MRQPLIRFLGIGLLAVAAVTGCRPKAEPEMPFWAVGAQKSGEFLYRTNGSGITITHYGGSNQVVRIPDAIQGLPVVEIGEGAFACCQNEGCYLLTSVTIPASVTNIGIWAFYGCPLTSAYFEGNAPYVEPEPDNRFQGFPVEAVYHLAGKTGWGPSFCNSPTAIWNPETNTTAKAQSK